MLRFNKSLRGFLSALGVIVAAGCTTAQPVELTQEIQPGTPTQPTLEQAYQPGQGQRYIVNAGHTVPDDMVVQGDTVVLTVPAQAIAGLGGLEGQRLRVRWSLETAAGEATLTPDEDNPAVARLLADGYGVNEVKAIVSVGRQRVELTATINCEFSTGLMIEKSDEIALPRGWQRNPLVGRTRQTLYGHREQNTARNPETGRLVTMWQIKFGSSDAAPMGMAVMHSDDNGLTWVNKRYLLMQDGQNAGWGSLCWNSAGNRGRGEFLLWACSHVRIDDNQLMLFRSRDDGETWQYLDNYAGQIGAALGIENTNQTYFGVNRTVATSHGTLVTPMVSEQFARAIWSDDNGRTWHNSNIDNTFPQGNEDAIVETIDGGKLILIARQRRGGPKRFESVDGGRTWEAIASGLTVPMTSVNFGLDRIDEPEHERHGQIMHCGAATREGPHGGRQMLAISFNSDPVDVSEDAWDTRLLLDYAANYSDLLYVPEDGSIFVSVETKDWGVAFTNWGDAPIRYFKFSPRYFENLPAYGE